MSKDIVDTARFDLRGPRDLLEKLDFDRGRFKTAKSKAEAVYIVFDCAVGAWSMIDWYHEHLIASGIKTSRKYIEDKLISLVPKLAACRLVATCAKHFVVRRGPKDKIYTSISTLYSKSIENGKLVRAPNQQMPMLHWNNETYICDDFFADVWSGLKLFLDENGITERSEWLHYEWPDDL